MAMWQRPDGGEEASHRGGGEWSRQGGASGVEAGEECAGLEVQVMGSRQRRIMQRMAGATGKGRGHTGETGGHLGVNLDQTAALEVVKCGPMPDSTCAWYVCMHVCVCTHARVCIFPSTHLPAQF